MERLPGELLLRIFHPLDHRSLAAARQGSGRPWHLTMHSGQTYSRRDGEEIERQHPMPRMIQNPGKMLTLCKTDATVLDGTKIIREGSDYYLIHQGEIRRFLGTSQPIVGVEGRAARRDDEERASAISDRILFFLGDLETVCTAAKRVRM
ncbi:uncharacterized protein LOC122015662 [Zingiber officinale]|uniref:uncharacterized protein LOC122015662 n=1 Tax=Zingiber officinale TaxID=94328 RepID=UPI001C4BF4B4|nr:uncharacterized protein LOC122015662 [Zingiber officinale]